MMIRKPMIRINTFKPLIISADNRCNRTARFIKKIRTRTIPRTIRVEIIKTITVEDAIDIVW